MAVPTIYILERKYEKYIYPFIPQFYYIKVGFRAVYGHVMLMRLIVAQTNYCVFSILSSFYKIFSLYIIMAKKTYMHRTVRKINILIIILSNAFCSGK